MQPSKIIFCRNCVISNQRPSSSIEFKKKSDKNIATIKIGRDGVCEACAYAQIKETEIDWVQREKSLIKLLNKFRSKTGHHDVVVPGSGGKDSAFTAHILKYKYGMNPLTVTWAPHLYTEIGWKNFINWSHVGGLDNILFTPNGRIHRFLTRSAFLNLLHPFQPFIIGQRKIGPWIAHQFKIRLVMYGENQAEYGNNINENKNPIMQESFFSCKRSKDLFLAGLTPKTICEQGKFRLKELAPYMPLLLDKKSYKMPEVHYLGYYCKWDPQECFYYASKNTGFVTNNERTEGTYSKYSSIDDKIDMFHYYTTLIKFGLGRASYDASQEIRNKKISRDEGVNLVKKYDQEFPKKYFSDFLEYISITDSVFFETINKFRLPHIWKKTKKTWILKKPVWAK